MGAVEITLGQNVAHQQAVLEALGADVGGPHLALLLQREDDPVALYVLG